MKNYNLKSLNAFTKFKYTAKLLGCTWALLGLISTSTQVYASDFNSSISTYDINQSKVTIKGVVVDERNEPIVGANIMEKGTSNGTISDIEGAFTLTVSSDATLKITFIGYVDKQLSIKGKTNFRVVLSEDTNALDEIVVVGYGTARKQDLTSAISSVKSEDIDKFFSGNIQSSLQGQVAGVTVVNSSGAPGRNPSVTIRGISNFGDNKPLYVVDGIPMGTDIRIQMT